MVCNDLTLKLTMSFLTGMMLSGMAWGASAEKTNPRFVTKGDTVYDNKSQLTWARCNVGQRWKERAGCEGKEQIFTFGEAQLLNRGKWHVPTKKELGTLLNAAAGKQKSKTHEENIQDMNLGIQTFWTSTPSGAGEDWGVCLTGDKFLNIRRTLGIAVRLVRSGQKP